MTLKSKLKLIVALASVYSVTLLAVLTITRMPVTHAQPHTGMGGRYWTAGVDGVGATLTKITIGADSATPDASMEAIYITDLYAQSTTTTGGQFILRHGVSTDVGGTANCGTDTRTFYPSAASTTARVSYPGNGVAGPTIQFRTPIRVPPGRDICALGVATNLLVLDLKGELRP